jgi:5-methylcytosine-specific restriction protein B
LTKENSSKEDRPYILIIDEINRGNVSSIFGELITLIEEDKRIGNDEELRLVLPYSKNEKEKFGVPSNLHIIGTMNTADRSVEALDTALRRRFVFEEMPPKPSIIQTKGKSEGGIIEVLGQQIDLVDLLQTINDRIEVLLDKDHLIGHSYFMKVTSLKGLRKAFSKNIIPLLQEYFYGDFGKIALVLGLGFCKAKDRGSKANKDIFAEIGNNDISDNYTEKIIYEIQHPKTDDEILKAINLLLNKKPVQTNNDES